MAVDASLKLREGVLEEREVALRVELAAASSGNAEGAEMRRQLEGQLSEVDFARQRLDGDVDALELARAAIDAKGQALEQQVAELKLAVMAHEAERKDVEREKQRAWQGSAQVQNDITLLERDVTNLRQREVTLVEKESRQARREAEWDSGRRHQESRAGDRERDLDEKERAAAARAGEDASSLSIAEQALRTRESNVKTEEAALEESRVNAVRNAIVD